VTTRERHTLWLVPRPHSHLPFPPPSPDSAHALAFPLAAPLSNNIDSDILAAIFPKRSIESGLERDTKYI
jgi:hypothetical protein